VNAQETTTKKNASEQQVTKKYTCPMHPEVVTDKPGKCPKCGKTLVEKKGSKKDGMYKMHDMHDKHDMHDMHDKHDKHDKHKMNDSSMMKKDSTKMKK
jgi:hypothetical protein